MKGKITTPTFTKKKKSYVCVQTQVQNSDIIPSYCNYFFSAQAYFISQNCIVFPLCNSLYNPFLLLCLSLQMTSFFHWLFFFSLSLSIPVGTPLSVRESLLSWVSFIWQHGLRNTCFYSHSYALLTHGVENVGSLYIPHSHAQRIPSELDVS